MTNIVSKIYEIKVTTVNMVGEIEEHFMWVDSDDIAEVQEMVFMEYGENEFEIVKVKELQNSIIN